MPSKSKAKKSKKKASKAATAVKALPDPREPLAATPATFKQSLGELERLLGELEVPAEPQQLDLVDAVMHIAFAEGLPCGYGQEARRRIADAYVDRNEFRVTEAYEVEALLADLEVPDLFARCQAVRGTISQIYADQNGVKLDFMREAGISDRNMFFQRVPSMSDPVVAFLTQLLTFEEIVFSDKSTVRAQQRIGLEPKNSAANDFFATVRALLKPYGHMPLRVGPDLAGGKPNLKNVLSPACVLVRLAPTPRVKRRR